MRLFLRSTLFALTMSAGAANAANQDFILVNSTGYQIDSVYVSGVNAKQWGKDVMGSDSLADGENVKIAFNAPAQACRWDLMVKYNDGDQAVWQDLNLCNINKVTLFWNSATQATTATVE